MKIKKNLTEADMFRNSQDNYSFENDVLEDDSRKKVFRSAVKKKKKEEELLLPKEAQEKLNRCLLEVSMEWLKGKNGDLDWKVKRDGLIITLTPVAKAKSAAL